MEDKKNIETDNLKEEKKHVKFDESTASIDLERRRMLFDIISQIKKEKIIIMVTHNIEECEWCDNIFAVKNKKVFKVNPNDIVQAF